MSKALRIGILGCARIVRRGFLAGIQQTSAATVTGIASRDGKTARDWAAEFGISKPFDSYDALIADPEIDAVYIPLPNELHAVWVLRAAAAGKHILCEKPLGLDYADAEKMVAGCDQHGVVLMEAFMWRHHPRVARARQLLAEGALGELRLIKMDFSFVIDPADWRLDPARGGGALYDLGCYGINAARLFTSAEPTEVHARACYHPAGVDMTMAMQLVFPNQVMALLDCSFECPDRNRLELVGTRGSLELPQGVLPAPETELILHTDAGDQTIRFTSANQYAGEIEAFCASVASGKLVSPAENGLANMLVLDRARQSASSG